MDQKEFRERTIRFALRCLEVAEALPWTSPRGRTIANQLARASTSVAANYRAACRAKSRADFVSKLGTVEEEADETAFWLELMVRTALLPASRLAPLLDEANQLTALIVASIRTAKRNR
jgi:four helix bundle protein